jgi:hypothetical protein
MLAAKSGSSKAPLSSMRDLAARVQRLFAPWHRMRSHDGGVSFWMEVDHFTERSEYGMGGEVSG